MEIAFSRQAVFGAAHKLRALLCNCNTIVIFHRTFALVFDGQWPDTSNVTLHGANEWVESMSFERRRYRLCFASENNVNI